MLLLPHLLKRFIQNGRLTVINHDGKREVFGSGVDGPDDRRSVPDPVIHARVNSLVMPTCAEGFHEVVAVRFMPADAPPAPAAAGIDARLAAAADAFARALVYAFVCA